MTPEETKRIADEATARCRGERGPATVAETLAIADQAVDRVSFATKLQWGAIAAVGLSLAGFVVWALTVVGTVGQAHAQAQAASARTAVLEQRIEGVDSTARAVDAGARVAVENLRKDVAAERADTNRKLTDMQLTLQAVLREVRRK